MSRIAPSSLIRMSISLFIGIVAAVITTIVFWNDGPGDDPARLKEAAAMLEQFGQHSVSNTIARITDGMKIESLNGPPSTVVSNSFGRSVPDDATGVWSVTLRDGRKFEVEGHPTPTADAIAPDIQQVAMEKPWKDIEELSRRLSWRNGRILRAKAMACLERKPDQVTVRSWDDRFESATGSYGICPNGKRVGETTLYGLCALALGTVASWTILPLTPWLWCLLRDRIRKISPAVRGK